MSPRPIEFGNLTAEETQRIAADALESLSDYDALEVIRDWALANGASDELIETLEDDHA